MYTKSKMLLKGQFRLLIIFIQSLNDFFELEG